jgi:ribonuclease HI
MYYAIKKGHKTGIFKTWEECKKIVSGYSNAQFKKFKNLEDAKSYLNEKKNKNKNKEMKIEKIFEIYTDGACPNNCNEKSKTAGIGIYFPSDTIMNVSENLLNFYSGSCTNQRAELTAIHVALNIILSKILHDSKFINKKIIIYTDSMYAVNIITKWMEKWEQNGWKRAGGKDISNLDIIINLKDAYDSLINIGINLEIKHVRGHQGIYGNEMADKLAVEGCDTAIIIK